MDALDIGGDHRSPNLVGLNQSKIEVYEENMDPSTSKDVENLQEEEVKPTQIVMDTSNRGAKKSSEPSKADLKNLKDLK